MSRAFCTLTLAWIAMLASAPAIASDDELELPGPAPQHRPPTFSAERANGECERCHATIAAEWHASYHRQANSNPAFVRALSREPSSFCRRCHAPEADPRHAASGFAAQNGVACVTCHVLGQQVTSGAFGATSARSPHPVIRNARLSGSGACQRCHEFQFPDASHRRRPEFMQQTVREHKNSAYADTSCIDCHMPKMADGHRSHLFLAGHDERTLRAALHVEATRQQTQLRLLLAPQRLGHAFPTGDLFRRLVVQVEERGECASPAQRRELQRHFVNEEQHPGVPVRVVSSDDRPFGPTELFFQLSPRCQEARWSVTYQRVAFPLDSADGRAVIDGEVLLASGVSRLPSHASDN